MQNTKYTILILLSILLIPIGSAAADTKVKEYGVTNETDEVKKLIQKTTKLQLALESTQNETKKNKIGGKITAIEQQLEEFGIPTWEKHLKNSSYWNKITMEKMDAMYGVSEYNPEKYRNDTGITGQSGSCSECKYLAFKVGWEYQCGLFKCVYAAPQYMILYNGQEYPQSIWYNGDRDEIFPFHYVRSSHGLTSGSYIWGYEAYARGTTEYDLDADHAERYFLLAHADHKIDYDSIANPIKPTKLTTTFTIEDIK